MSDIELTQLPNGVFTGSLQSSKDRFFEFRVFDNHTPIVYKLVFVNDVEQQRCETLLSKPVVSGGFSAKISYSSTLTSVVHQWCWVDIRLSPYMLLTMRMRVKSIDLYEGDDPCFPYACDDAHTV